MGSLPYVTSPRNIERAFEGIKAAATPARVSQDFVKTILKIAGGSGDQMTSFLKKIGFANADGTPADLYNRFRNPATSGAAAAQALKRGYAPLYKRNEFMHELPDDKLRGLVIEETGQGKDSSTLPLIIGCIKAIKKYADWKAGDSKVETADDELEATAKASRINAKLSEAQTRLKTHGLNLSYTINLNLPATTDIAVFNAIFRSLRDNLLKEASNEE
jgi:hypothetical protein